MNERIKELAEQAKEYADTKYSKLVSASRWGDCVPGIRELYTEKFAELIVKECAGIVQPYMSRWPEDAELTKRIKEHFGVKE
jgi:hypothetical protein